LSVVFIKEFLCCVGYDAGMFPSFARTVSGECTDKVVTRINSRGEQ